MSEHKIIERDQVAARGLDNGYALRAYVTRTTKSLVFEIVKTGEDRGVTVSHEDALALVAMKTGPAIP